MGKWPWIFALASALAGCQLVAGGFDVVPDDPEQVAGECTPSEQRCNGQFLLACAADGSDWVLRDTCATSDLCDSSSGRCESCERGQLRCDGADRQECNAQGNGWEVRETCSAEGMCNPTYCGTCAPGEYSCRGSGSTAGAELWECGPDSTWSVNIATCASAGLCALSIDQSRGATSWAEECTDPLCPAPGEYRCNGQALERCRQDLTGWELVDTCRSPELCAVGVQNASQGGGDVDMCPPGCPSAGSFLCEGMMLETCREDLTGWDVLITCEAGTECNPVQGACSERCEPGHFQCNGATLRQCTPAQSWEEVAQCASAALCTTAPDELSGACAPPACPSAGTFQCAGAELQQCREDLLGWDPVETCASAELCSALDRRCNQPLCAADELRCFDNELRRCSASLDDWEVVTTCGAGEFCDNSSDAPGCKLECPSPTRCNGSELEQCTPNGWIHRANCATNELCSCTLDGSCTLGTDTEGCGVPVCGGSKPEFQCDGATLQRCDDSRNAWFVDETCASAALCYPGEAPLFENGYCATCPTAGEVRCARSGSQTRLEVCSGDRKRWSATQSCSSTYGCVDSGAADYCATCNDGQVQCSGPTLQRCGADRKSWVSTTCASASLCDAAGNQCDVCRPNQNTCDGTTLQHCSSDGQQLQSQMCPRYCDAQNGECDGCMANTSRCANEVLYRCNSTGQGETATTCATAALCNAGSGSCTQPTCDVGQKRCSGSQPQQCNANRNGWESAGAACATSALCNSATGTCTAPTCNSGQRRCDGSQPQVCNGNRNGWNDSGSACATAALCNAATGMCTTPACAAGERRCNGAQPEVCNADRTGFVADGTACGSVALCSGGTCTAAACSPNDRRCDGAQPQVCRSDRTGYQDDGDECATSALCQDGQCRSPACDAGEYRCDAAVLSRCNAGRTGFEQIATCTSAALCDDDAGQCREAACSAGTYRCNEAALELCRDDAAGWNTVDTCSSAELCDAAGAECDECRPPSFDCTDGDVLRECDDDGHFSEIAECDPGLCDEAAGVCLMPPDGGGGAGDGDAR